MNSAARTFGEAGTLPRDECYGLAKEFIELVYKLWDGSWETMQLIGTRSTACLRGLRRSKRSSISKAFPYGTLSPVRTFSQANSESICWSIEGVEHFV